MNTDYNTNITYHELPLEDLGYIKEQRINLTLATFDKNPQSYEEWESIVSPSVGWVSSSGKDYARVNLTKFGPGSRFWIIIERISPAELDVYVVERINGIDTRVY